MRYYQYPNISIERTISRINGEKIPAPLTFTICCEDELSQADNDSNRPASDFLYMTSVSFQITAGDSVHSWNHQLYLWPLCKEGQKYEFDPDAYGMYLNGDFDPAAADVEKFLTQYRLDWSIIQGVFMGMEEEFISKLISKIERQCAAEYACYLGAEIVNVRPQWLPYFFNGDCGDMSPEDIEEADYFNSQLLANGFMAADKMEKVDGETDDTFFGRPSFCPNSLPGECEEWIAFPADYIETYKRING